MFSKLMNSTRMLMRTNGRNKDKGGTPQKPDVTRDMVIDEEKSPHVEKKEETKEEDNHEEKKEETKEEDNHEEKKEKDNQEEDNVDSTNRQNEEREMNESGLCEGGSEDEVSDCVECLESPNKDSTGWKRSVMDAVKNLPLPGFAVSNKQMAQRVASSNGNQAVQNLNREESQEDLEMKNEQENAEGQTDGKVGEYVRDLLKEKMSLDPSQWPNAMRLIDSEVKQAQSQGGKSLKENRYVDIYREKPIRVAVKVLVPVKEHPKFNFVGKLLGPKGNSLKRLQEDTMTKMAILGRGSMRDKAKEEEMRQALDPKYAHLSDDLHVEIAALAPPAEAHARIAYALAEIRKYLVPDSNDEIRQEQMREIQAEQPRQGPPGAPLLRGVGRGRAPPRGPPIGMPPPRNSLLAAPRPAPPLPPLLPRPQQGKTKVLSILDRARVAMEESYGGYEDPADMGQGFYDSPAGGFNSGPGNHRPPLLPRPPQGKTKGHSILDRARVSMEESYGGYDDADMGQGGFYDSPSGGFNSGPGYGGDYNGGAGDYYNTSNYTDSASGRWKSYKETGLGSGVRAAAGAGGGATRFGGPRATPYARPPK